MLTIGPGFTVIVKVLVSPSQTLPFITGVTVIVLVIGSLVSFSGIKVGISVTPVSPAIKLILILSFVQLNVKFGEVPDQLPDKGITGNV